MDPEHKCPAGWDVIQLLAYVDGELEDASCRQLERHVQECSFCAGELASLRRMDALLKEHPESFHLDEEVLYRFVSQGDDPDGKIAAHLVSCGPCRNDAELLREMIAHRTMPIDQVPSMPRALFRELERSEPVTSPGMFSRLLAAMAELLRLPFRMPVLALGSAATILIVAVVGLPMWRSFQERRLAEFLPVQTKRSPASIATREVPEKQEAPKDAVRADHPRVAGGVISPRTAAEMPAEPHRRKTEAEPFSYREEEKAEKHSLSKSKEKIAHPAQDVANLTTPSPAAPPVESKLTAPSAPQKAPAPAALEPGQSLERQQAPASETGKPALGMSAPRPKMHGVNRAAKKDTRGLRDESRAPASATAPITVRIIDAQGNPVEWAKAALPADLEKRFRLVIRESTESDAERDRTSSLKGEATDAKATQKPALHIEIRIHQSADAYDVDSKLLDASSHREIASVVVVRVSRAEVPGTIESSIRRLLEHQR